jgi:hypothetical protein
LRIVSSRCAIWDTWGAREAIRDASGDEVRGLGGGMYGRARG